MFTRPAFVGSFGSATLCLVSGIIVGCTSPGAVPVSRGNAAAKSIAAEFDADRSMLLENRYLLVPITLDEPSQSAIYFGSVSFSKGSWSGMGSGPWGSSTVLNIEIVDLQEKTHHRVFNHPVAVGQMDLTFNEENQGKPAAKIHPRPASTEEQAPLAFPGHLVLHARTNDTTGDGQITWKDEVGLYAYDLIAGTLRRLSPEGYHVARARRWEEGILMVLLKQPERQEAAVYIHNMAEKGYFAAQGLSPHEP
jgi:hypothetical protein